MTTSSSARFEALAQSTYVSIESYRKSGETVRTPVNIMSDEDKLYCWTPGNSGKVKRIRNNETVNLAKCNARGKVEGEWVHAKARVVEDRDEARVLSRRLADKHGLPYMIGMPLFRLYCFLRGEPCLCIEFSLV
ncbi:MAG: PPOX class F420-dependent oxidoreductase [Chloroflexi bacterium]|nr:PPOX class F420-dependent oxidoreductase [Chloroflexota bacterium]